MMMLLTSSYYSKNYLSISEKIFIELMDSLNFHRKTLPIYKNGEYIFKAKSLNYYFKQFEHFYFREYIQIIYYIVNKIGKKFYMNNNKMKLLCYICKRAEINYKILENNFIELLIITNLEYKKEIYFEGNILISYGNNEIDNSLFTKIGDYVLFL